MSGHACPMFVRVRVRGFRTCPCPNPCPCPKSWLPLSRLLRSRHPLFVAPITIAIILPEMFDIFVRENTSDRPRTWTFRSDGVGRRWFILNISKIRLSIIEPSIESFTLILYQLECFLIPQKYILNKICIRPRNYTINAIGKNSVPSWNVIWLMHS